MRCLDEGTRMTPLHLAVLAKDKDSELRMLVIKRLLALYPEATHVKCQTARGGTPLLYACYDETNNDISVVAHDAQVVEIFLMVNQTYMNQESKLASSIISWHVKYVSKMMRSSPNAPVETSLSVLRVFARHCHQSHLEQALEVLYACNSQLVMDMLTKEETRARHNIQQFGRQTRPSSNLQGNWVWEWVLAILGLIHTKICGDEQQRPFYPLHVAAQLTDCPPAFLLLAMRTFPGQVRSRDQKTLNLPLHSIASWKIPEGRSLCRKSTMLTSFVSDFPPAMDMPNATGKTPVQLEEDSGSKVV